VHKVNSHALRPLAQTSTQTYDSMKRVLTALNGKGRLASLVDPSSGASIPAYDLNDNITGVTAPDGTTASIAYDTVNRVTETTDALGIVRRVAYDVRDNIIAITDGRGSTTTFAYDALDRQVSRTNPTGNVWRFEYDARDLRTAVIKPDGTRVAFVHDSRQRLTSAGVAGDGLSQRACGYGGFSYAGLLNTAASATGTGNALSYTFQYDARDQMTRQSQGSSAFGPAWNVDSVYDALGRRTLMSNTGGARTGFGYDAPA
jgi:YD repeat-containing protein